MYPICEKARAVVHNSDAISIRNCAFASPCFFTEGIQKPNNSEISVIGCVSKHTLLWKLFFLSSRPLQTMGKILEISVAKRKCPFVSRGSMVETLCHYNFDHNVLFETLYIYVNIYIYIFVLYYTKYINIYINIIQL